MAAGIARGAAFIQERLSREPGLDDVLVLAARVTGRDAELRTRTPRFRDPLVPAAERLAAELPRLGAALSEVAALARSAPAPEALTREAARAHLVFEEVHPFADANGRIGRLLLAWQLLAAGHPAPRWQLRDRDRYLDAVRERDLAALAALIAARSAASSPCG